MKFSKWVIAGLIVAAGLSLSLRVDAQPSACESSNPVAIVECVAQQSADETPADRKEMLRQIALALNANDIDSGNGASFGILRKEAGHRCGADNDPFPVSCDIVCAGNGAPQRQWDVFISGDSQRPAFNLVGEPLRRDECAVPAASPDPNPDPDPDPDPQPDPALDARVSALEAQVVELRFQAESMTQGMALLARQNADQQDAINALVQRLDAVEAFARAFGCRATIFGIPVSCQITGR